MKFKNDEVFAPEEKSSIKGKLGKLFSKLAKDNAPTEYDDENEEIEAGSEKLDEYFGEDAKYGVHYDDPPKKPKIDWKSLTQNRLYVGIACIVLAALIGFVFVPLSAHVASVKTIEVVRASADIAKGTKIEPSMLEMVEIGAQNVPITAVTDATLAVGKYAVNDIAKEENLLSSKIANEPPIGEQYLTELPNGDLAVSVSVKSFASGLSGKLLPGDIVSVYVNLNDNANQYDYHSTLLSELYYVEVLAVSNEDVGDVNEAEPTPENPDMNTLPTTVTLRCTNLEQARTLIGLETKGTIHMALMSRGDTPYKKELLNAQQQYFVLLAQQQALMSQQYYAQQPTQSSHGTSDESSDTADESSSSATYSKETKEAKKK